MICRPARPPGASALADLAEIGRPVALAHRLEHLDGGDAVEGALDVAVVDQANVGLLGQALLEHALSGEVELFLARW